MKNYSFSNLAVRPFPTIADLNNPWIFGGVQVLINVSGHEYHEEVLKAIESKGIRWYIFGRFLGGCYGTGLWSKM